jgi:hypothetical protein
VPDVDPATPHAFGCHTCLNARRAQTAAEHVAGRLLTLLAEAEAREARQRAEIGDLEARLAKHLPTWEVESA